MPDEVQDEIQQALQANQREEERYVRINRAQKGQIRRLEGQVQRLEEQVDLLTAIDNATIDPPKWVIPAKKSKRHVGISNLVLSDLHLDEVVELAEVAGVNKYNREIAEMRLKRCFERFLTVSRDYLQGIDYEGACVWLGGDIFSGNIHEELKQTNETSIMASIDYWIDPVIAGIRMVADDKKKVILPGVVGNHGRNTRKPVAKHRVEDNFDWLFYRQLERAFADDKRVSFVLPKSADCMMQQYGTKFLFTHGDQFRGGSGIAGLLSPLMLGDARKRKRQAGLDDPYDYMVMGHWHQYSTFKGIIVNGSLKGYDEYAYISNFDYEPAQQAFWVTTPENGVTFSAPIFCEDRVAEGWA